MRRVVVQHSFRRTAAVLGLPVVFVLAPLVIGSVRFAAPEESEAVDGAPSFSQAVTAAFPTAEAGFVPADRAGS